MFNIFKTKVINKETQNYNPDEACITCTHVMQGNKPILYIKRDEDGGYQFLCGAASHENAEAMVVGIGEIVKKDGRIGSTLPLAIGEKIEILPGGNGKGTELKKIIKDGFANIIQKDIANGKVSLNQLFNDGEIVYYNGKNGTWFDWDVNGRTSWFTVCFNDKKKMGYISFAINKAGEISGYKWGNFGNSEPEKIDIGKLNVEDTNYLVRLLLQQTDDRSHFDKSIDSIDWEASIVLEDLSGSTDNKRV